jgi:hypothetical protein
VAASRIKPQKLCCVAHNLCLSHSLASAVRVLGDNTHRNTHSHLIDMTYVCIMAEVPSCRCHSSTSICYTINAPCQYSSQPILPCADVSYPIQDGILSMQLNGMMSCADPSHVPQTQHRDIIRLSTAALHCSTDCSNGHRFPSEARKITHGGLHASSE